MRDGAIRPWLDRALREALRARDTVTVSAVRSALAALDNAQAVSAAPAPGASDSPHVAGAAAGSCQPRSSAVNVPKDGLLPAHRYIRKARPGALRRA